MFESATFHSSNILQSKNPRWLLLALGVNLSILTALVVIPILNPQSLSTTLIRQVLYAPTPPLPKPVPTLTRSAQPLTPITVSLSNPLLAPRVTPSQLPTADTAPPTGDATQATLSDGPAGATPNINIFHTSAPQPTVKPDTPKTIHLSTGVELGAPLFQTTPAYPAIAKATGVSGTVVLDATISTTGTIENLRVLSGPALLRPAALQAVQQWRYRPYLLNHQPVEVETTINIVFSLNR